MQQGYNQELMEQGRKQQEQPSSVSETDATSEINKALDFQQLYDPIGAQRA